MTGGTGLFARLRRALSLQNELIVRGIPSDGVAAVCGSGLRNKVRIAGRVVDIRTFRRGGTDWFEAVVADDSGTIQLIWVGRSAIPGIEVGTNIVASGRLAERNTDLIIHNPRYELL